MELELDLELLEDIKGFEGRYQINRKGQIWSLNRKIFMKPSLLISRHNKSNKSRYLRIELKKDKKGHKFLLHRLLALQFIPNPLNLPEVDHKDINSLNNSLENLRWSSRRTNNNNRTLKSKSGEKNIRLQRNKYRVEIYENKKTIYDKCFKTIEEAIGARDTFLRENNLY